MKLPVNRAAVLVLTLASTAPLKTVSAQEQPQAQKTVGANEETSTSMPELADVIPLSAELTVRQAALVSEMEDRLDPSEVEDGYERVQAEVDRLAERFERLRTSEDYKQNEFVELSDALRQERESFEETSQRVREAIRRLADFREDWVAEEKRWNEWRDVLIQEKGLDQLGSTFEKVHATIDDALGLVVRNWTRC